MDAKIKVSKTPELSKILSLKPEVDQNIARFAYARQPAFLISTSSFHSP